MKKKGQRTFNNENVHRIKMLGLTLYPLYSPQLLEIFHQRGKVIDSSPASKSAAPSETKYITSPSLSRPQKLSRTTRPETHRPRITMRPRDQARSEALIFQCSLYQNHILIYLTLKNPKASKFLSFVQKHAAVVQPSHQKLTNFFFTLNMESEN